MLVRLTGESDLDASGCLIFPGFGDVHIHAREDTSGEEMYKEDFVTMSAGRDPWGRDARGRYAEQPRGADRRCELCGQAGADAKLGGTHHAVRGHWAGHVAALTLVCLTRRSWGLRLGSCFFGRRSSWKQVIARYRGCNVSFHCEDPILLEQHKGEALHERRRPAAAEVSATEFALQLIERYELVGKLCHFSTRDGLEKIRDGAETGCAGALRGDAAPPVLRRHDAGYSEPAGAADESSAARARGSAGDDRGIEKLARSSTWPQTMLHTRWKRRRMG